MPSENRFLALVRRFPVWIDHTILIAVGIGVVALAGVVLIEAFADFLRLGQPQHSVAHITSELMFVLILVELFRQVVRHLQQAAFTLNPFLFIGIIASIRGILLAQMRLALGEMDWAEGMIQLGVYGGIVLVMVVCHAIVLRNERSESRGGGA